MHKTICSGVSVDVASPGAQAWLDELATDVTNSWTMITQTDDGIQVLRKPWGDIIAYLDSLDLSPQAARDIGVGRAERMYVAHRLEAIGPQFAPRTLLRASADNMLDHVDWDFDLLARMSRIPSDGREWLVDKQSYKLAVFCLDKYLFGLKFHCHEEGKWSMGWTKITPVPQGLGLFPRASIQLRAALEDFLTTWNPESLGFSGGDAKRADFYTQVVPSWTPDGYSPEIHRDEDDVDEDGKCRNGSIVFRRQEIVQFLAPKS